MAKRSQNLIDNDRIVAETLGRRLYLLRSSRHMTLEQVAKKVSVTHQVLSSYERGTRKPSLSILIGLSTYYDTTVDYLLGLEPLEKEIEIDDPRLKMKNYVTKV